MAIGWIQPSFAGGEIGPSLYGRIDMAKYQVALRKCDNFIVGRILAERERVICSTSRHQTGSLPCPAGSGRRSGVTG